jgi:hypothetical protein
MTTPQVTVEDQIACVRREIRMRQSVYPRWVDSGKMTPKKATDELEAMAAVLETLIEVQAQTRLL